MYISRFSPALLPALFEFNIFIIIIITIHTKVLYNAQSTFYTQRSMNITQYNEPPVILCNIIHISFYVLKLHAIFRIFDIKIGIHTVCIHYTQDTGYSIHTLQLIHQEGPSANANSIRESRTFSHCIQKFERYTTVLSAFQYRFAPCSQPFHGWKISNFPLKWSKYSCSYLLIDVIAMKSP